MAVRLTSTDADFPNQFNRFLATKREVSADVDAVVSGIVARVRADGDKALIALSAEFDKLDLTKLGLRVTAAEITAAVNASEKATLAALEFARDRIAQHHERQKPADAHYRDAIGAELGSRWTAVESVGLYVPGGLASYPSSVLMNALPARVAGVPRVVMVVGTAR